MSRKPKPKTVRSLQQNDNQHSDSDSDESYLYTVNNPNKNNANGKVTIAAVSLTTMVDTGASINVIDEQTFSKFREVTLKGHWQQKILFLISIILTYGILNYAFS